VTVCTLHYATDNQCSLINFHVVLTSELVSLRGRHMLLSINTRKLLSNLVKYQHIPLQLRNRSITEV